jgi:hypothetical protein
MKSWAALGEALPAVSWAAAVVLEVWSWEGSTAASHLKQQGKGKGGKGGRMGGDLSCECFIAASQLPQ